MVTFVALAISYSMAMQKTIDMATDAFSNENSMLYRMSQLYFRYQQRLREVRRASRRRDREERRREDEEFREEEQRLIQQQQAAQALMSGEALPEDVAAIAGEDEKKLNTAAASDQESVPDDIEGVGSGPGSRGRTPNKSNNNRDDGAPPAPSAS